MKGYKGVLFDFNGTMYFDKEINDIAWLAIINELSQEKVDDLNVFSKGMATYQNTSFAKGILQKLCLPCDPDTIRDVWTRKEEIYIHLAKERKMFSLVPGLADYLDHLKTAGIPVNIASLAPKMNFDYYFEYLGLGEWFDMDKIVYDDCISYSDKVSMYLKSAKNISLEMKDCLVFEDSDTGVQDAKKAGCRNAIQIYRKDHKPILDEIVIDRINDYTELKDR
ncbi:MAG: HAD family hydrolase [Erysipelotrichaceae bacterium]|nr:HAD family hydrolase [Erysipelotrichaceae bacterium]